MKSKPTIGIIGGTGKMGQWFAHFFQQRDIPVLISGRKTTLTPEALAKKADIVIVTVPISETQKVIQSVAKHVRKDALLTDLTSFKVMPLEAMENAPSATLGMHPLFAPTASTSQDLQIVFCHQKDNQYVDFLQKLFEEAGIAIVKITADEHDYQMAYIQAFTHTINLLYAKIIFEQKDMLKNGQSSSANKLVTPIFTLQTLIMGRVLYQDLKLISDIQFYNPYFLPVLQDFAEQAKNLEKIIETQDVKAFEQMFTKEQQLAKNFASFAAQKTNTILRLAREVNINIPNKVARAKLPGKFKIAYLGPIGTFSHQAVKTVFGKHSTDSFPCETLYDVFEAVAQDNATVGIVPIENSHEGPVHATLDYLANLSLTVIGSFTLPVHHQLLSEEGQLSDIKTVVSHPQALAQCRMWLRENLPHAKIVAASSTTAAIKKGQRGTAFISSQEAADQYNLPILKTQIEDDPTNTTKFYVIAKKPFKTKGLSSSQTLLFLSVHNRVGILRDILNIFAKHNLDLTKLESRPSKAKAWDYHFFVEIRALPESKSVKEAIKELEPLCPIIRIIGFT